MSNIFQKPLIIIMDEFNNLLEKKEVRFIEDKMGEKEKGVEEKMIKTEKKEVTNIELEEGIHFAAKSGIKLGILSPQ